MVPIVPPAKPPTSPLVTVVLLCFNYENFVDEALAGLFAQTYKPLDIIIVDDCSSDRSAEIISDRLRERGNPSNVRFVRNKRNLVHPIPSILGLVNGRFVVIASADDVMLPTMVEAMARTWIEEKVSLVTGNALYIDSNSNYLNRVFRPLALPADDSFETLCRDGANACCFGAAMGFETAIYQTFGWPPTDFLECSDIILPFYSYFLGGARFLRGPLLKYRIHSANTSLSLQSEKAAGEARLLSNDRSLRNQVSHAILFDKELDRLQAMAPGQFAEKAQRVRPLVKELIAEAARKLDQNRLDLHKLRYPPSVG